MSRTWPTLRLSSGALLPQPCQSCSRRLLELLDEGDVVALEQDLADVAPLLGRVLLGEGHFALLPWQLRHANNDVGYNVRRGRQAVLLKRTSRGASRRCSCQFVGAS
jgi:hypothetical protein